MEREKLVLVDSVATGRMEIIPLTCAFLETGEKRRLNILTTVPQHRKQSNGYEP